MTDRRRDVVVLDCTIRDGGCCNAWNFEPALVRSTFEALLAAGIDIMEIGYQTGPGVFAPGEVGRWRYCREDDLRQVAHESAMRLSCMLDMGRIGKKDLRPADDSLIDILRIATYGRDVPEAIELAHHAQQLGYEVFINVMAVSTCTPQEVDRFLEHLRNSAVTDVAVVDSYGAMYPHHIRYLIRKYKNWLRDDQRVGVHFHNNQQTAFANTIAAIDEGADVVDATLFGFGRGAGNCPLELLLMYLDRPSYDVRKILPLLAELGAMRDDLRWGYHPPYAITGWLDLHPADAIEQMTGATRYEVLEFWDRLTEHRPVPRYHRPRRE
jgi:4-hydroxy 2-oxovalerate aldolase